MKKCTKCGAPLEGFLYKTIGKLMGIKPSDKNPEVCNKCEEESSTESTDTSAAKPEATMSETEPALADQPATEPEPAVSSPSPEAEKEVQPNESVSEDKTEGESDKQESNF